MCCYGCLSSMSTIYLTTARNYNLLAYSPTSQPASEPTIHTSIHTSFQSVSQPGKLLSGVCSFCCTLLESDLLYCNLFHSNTFVLYLLDSKLWITETTVSDKCFFNSHDSLYALTTLSRELSIFSYVFICSCFHYCFLMNFINSNIDFSQP